MKTRAVFTGWTCVSGPAELVHYLVRNGQEVSYGSFVREVDLRSLDWDEASRRLLKSDWHVTWLRSRLPSDAPAWVMQHSRMEHLFLLPQDASKLNTRFEAGLVCPDSQSGAHHKDNQGLCHYCGVKLPDWFW